MFSFFKRRDAKLYPPDEIGDQLYKMWPKPESLPAKATLWYDAYFDTEADADAISKDLYERRINTERDHDDTPDGGFGAFNVEWEFPVNARHLDLKMAHDDMLRRISQNHGKLGSWLLLHWLDEEDDD